jgi:hypothetical protein
MPAPKRLGHSGYTGERSRQIGVKRQENDDKDQARNHPRDQDPSGFPQI